MRLRLSLSIDVYKSDKTVKNWLFAIPHPQPDVRHQGSAAGMDDLALEAGDRAGLYRAVEGHPVDFEADNVAGGQDAGSSNKAGFNEPLP